MEEDVKTALKRGFSETEEGKAVFARSVSLISTNMSPEWNRKQFIPFLTDWLNFNNEFLTSVIASQITTLGIKCEGIAFVSPLISLIICARNKVATKLIEQSVAQFKEDKTFPWLIDILAQSEFDDIRSFVPRIIHFLPDQEKKIQVLTKLATDPSFCVRMSVLKYLSKQEVDVAKQISQKMINDKSEKLRSYIAAATVKFSFWISSILPTLEKDQAWQVRASAASQLVNWSMLSAVVPVAVRLAHDPSWEVKLIALRSLSSILNSNPKLAFREGLVLIKDLTDILKRYQQNSIHAVVVEVFIEILKRDMNNYPEDSWLPLLTSIITEQPASIKLHFFQTIAKSGFTEIIPLIGDKFRSQIELIAMDRNWRIRETVAKSLETFLKFFPGEDTNTIIQRAAIKLLKDEALPVRDATASFIAKSSLKDKDNAIPEIVITYKSSNKYRERQTALLILERLREETKSKEFKTTIMNEIASLKADPVFNVSFMASELEQPQK